MNLTKFGATVLTAKMLKIGRTADEVAVKMNRYNFLTRVEAVQKAVKLSPSDAVAYLKNHSWFTNIDAGELQAVIEENSPEPTFDGIDSSWLTNPEVAEAEADDEESEIDASDDEEDDEVEDEDSEEEEVEDYENIPI